MVRLLGTVLVASSLAVSVLSLPNAQGQNRGSGAGTVIVARPTTVVLAPAPGSDPIGGQSLGDVRIDESVVGALKRDGRVQITLPSGLRFEAVPTVSAILSHGLAFVGDGHAKPRLEEGDGRVFTFALGEQSTTGPAKVLVSSISVSVDSTFRPGPVVVSVEGQAAGVTPEDVTVARAVAPSVTPIPIDLWPDTVGQGADQREVVVTGLNFVAGATVSFGEGMTYRFAVDPSTRIVTTMSVAPDAQPGVRAVRVTNPSGESAMLEGLFRVTPAPTVGRTDRTGLVGLLRGVDVQRIVITGTGFQSPGAAPSSLQVSVEDTNIRVARVGFVSPEMIWAEVDVSDEAKLGPRRVTVVNPDGGRSTSTDPVLEVIRPPPGQPVGSGVRRRAILGPRLLPGAPEVTRVDPQVARAGATLVVEGKGFAPSAESNLVTFPGPGNTRLPAIVQGASESQLTVLVPSGAVDGPVTVSVNGMVAETVRRESALVAITTLILSGVAPAGIRIGHSNVELDVSGHRFANGAQVTLRPSDGVKVESVQVLTPKHLRLVVTVAHDAVTEPRALTVTNPLESGGDSTTLEGGLILLGPESLTFSLANQSLESYLPSVDSVVVSLASGICDAKTVTPHSVEIQVMFRPSPANPTAPATLALALDPFFTSALPGTATNEDCELGAIPTRDFSIRRVGDPSDVTSQQVIVTGSTDPSGVTLYRAMLDSWDWGGRVRIRVAGLAGGVPVTASLDLPVDSDGDGLPDAYENDGALNAKLDGSNALDIFHPDLDGNGSRDADDQAAPDGLSNFEKYRGVYLVGPAPGASARRMDGYTRLGTGKRHLFVRGMGFAGDPYVTNASPGGVARCGLLLSTSPLTPAAHSGPCPPFEVGAAFANRGVEIHDVTGSFTGVGAFSENGTFSYRAKSQLPEQSMMQPTTSTSRILQRVTVLLAAQCQSSAKCPTYWQSPRHWEFADLGFEGGTPTLYKKAIDAYFADRPYKHQENAANAIAKGPDGRIVLAPLALVGDHNDDGEYQPGEDLDNAGVLKGDLRIADEPNDHDHDLSAVDTTSDGCVELPLVADPSHIQPCDPTLATASPPQATRRQVVRWVITHELGHAVGRADHTGDPTDLMYGGRISWTTDDHFSDESAGYITIQNRWPPSP